MENPNNKSLEELRSDYSERILQSDSQKTLIVAGPGTGKTFTFRKALENAGGRGLALTFINNLVRDLDIALSDIADAHTFHGFCKNLLHHMAVEGLTNRFHYYPQLYEICVRDLSILLDTNITVEDIEKWFHTLDNSQQLLSEVLRIGNYYDAVSHTDSVYRVLEHLKSHPDSIPSYPLIVVDEYQDFSLLETEFLDTLSTGNRVLVAGDDDQALYAFKHASPDFIRRIALDSEFEVFHLPFCSRCTQVIVDAVVDVIGQARSRGMLCNRLEKPFECYVPDKAADSKVYPSIIHANCSVERGNAPYMGRYVSSQVSRISEEDIQVSRREGYPTVLVIGPAPFPKRVYDELDASFADVEFRKAPKMSVSIIDGYRCLSENEQSRLGWRIILTCDPIAEDAGLIRAALSNSGELSTTLPLEYRERHLTVARLLGKLLRSEQLTEEETALIESSTELQMDELLELFLSSSSSENDTEEFATLSPSNELNPVPQIICTSLTGAKGLSACHVFIVGLNNGHFPRSPDAITDAEVCQLLVALSRTRKQCHLVSCRSFGSASLRTSAFLEWIDARCTTVNVNATYFRGLN